MTSGLEVTLVWVTMLVGLVTLSVEGHTKTERTEDKVEVQLKQGLIYTVREDAGQGRYFYSFKGIPYAKPPVRELRFMDPVPADNWSGPRNGSIAPPLCPQLEDDEVTGSEDCLYLNVYTPAPLTAGLPVMVWIHGGSFQNGGGEGLYPPLPLMTKDIVLVAVHYRLGTLGFLSTEDSVVPGNMGLKDQTLALRWVQDNIRDFGGDPAKVTIFGESAGGASVHFQLLTPMAQGLFSRAILQSGTALCSWALREDHRRVAITLGRHFKCSHVDDWSPDALDSARLLPCLQQVPVEDLFLVTVTSFYVWGQWPTVMRPRVDGYYLPDHPATLLRSGRFNKVDIISGSTQHEGATHTIGIILRKELTQAVKQNFAVAGPASLLIEPEEDSHVYLARRVYYQYLGETEISEEKAEEFTEMISDSYYRVCQEQTAQLHAALGSLYGPRVFKYELQHRGRFGFADYHNSSLNENWVGHADDLQYLFSGQDLGPVLEDPADLFMRHIILTLWINFAATGNPTPDGSLGFRWWPTSQSHPWYLALTTSPVMKDNVLVQELELWKNMPTKGNLLLYPERFLKNGTCPAAGSCGECC